MVDFNIVKTKILPDKCPAIAMINPIYNNMHQLLIMFE
jgi:hypothetical protein